MSRENRFVGIPVQASTAAAGGESGRFAAKIMFACLPLEGG